MRFPSWYSPLCNGVGRFRISSYACERMSVLPSMRQPETSRRHAECVGDHNNGQRQGT
jgi:hypothetical protein